MNYYYWVASLPMLKFDGAMPITAADFSERYAPELGASDAEQLRIARLLPDSQADAKGALAEFWKYETNLRNAVVRRRAGRSGVAAKNLREERDFYSDIEGAVQEAANLAALDKEKAIDRARWNKLDDLEAKHAFDGDFFVLYKLRLEILGKYAGRTAANGETGFRTAVAGVLENSENSNRTQGA